MLGWHISVYKQIDNGAVPATFDSPHGTRLAVWQTGVSGLGWLDELVKQGKAIDLGGTGYPSRFTAPAEDLIPRIKGNPPGARSTWACAGSDVLTEKWEGKTVVDGAASADCRPDEWLLVEVWDES